MKVGDLNIKWRYTKTEEGEEVTICQLVEDGEVTLAETATRSKNDRYDKETGRKLSLTRVLKFLNKKVRKEVWEKYRTMTKKPRWELR